jgi:hypothetical protein
MEEFSHESLEKQAAIPVVASFLTDHPKHVPGCLMA